MVKNLFTYCEWMFLNNPEKLLHVQFDLSRVNNCNTRDQISDNHWNDFISMKSQYYCNLSEFDKTM